VGKIGEDQIADLAVRCATPEDELRKWLGPNLS